MQGFNLETSVFNHNNNNKKSTFQEPPKQTQHFMRMEMLASSAAMELQ